MNLEKNNQQPKKTPYNILTDYKRTGNSAMDGVASCIMYHRQRHIGLKAIHLKLFYYDMFKRYTEKILGRSLEDGELLMFDHVNIEKGSIFQAQAFLPETFNDSNRNLGIHTDNIKN